MTSPRASRTPAADLPVVPRWVPAATLVLAVAGVAVAGYLTVEHYTASTTLACPDQGIVNCQKVTTSAQAAVFGIPVALLGLAFFAAMAVGGLPAAWRTTRPLIRYGRATLALAGAAFVGYLVYAELFVLNAICLWCTAVHILAIALFGVVAFGTALFNPPEKP
jgi:uncharacterized membrane protein